VARLIGELLEPLRERLAIGVERRPCQRGHREHVGTACAPSSATRKPAARLVRSANGISRQLRESFALLRTRRFGTYWFATLLSNIGFWAQEVAQPWLLLSLGASSFVIGLDSFVGDAPAWLLTLAGGILADHYSRRRIITAFQSIQMLCPIALVVLLVTGTVQPWMVIVSSFVVGVTDALSMPSFQSIVPSIVEPDQIGAGLALSSTQFNLSRILGPAIAGVLITGIGVIGCFAINAASYIPFILIALWILPRREPARVPFDRAHPLAGIRAVVKQPYLRGALLTVFATTLLCGPLITFCPVLIRDAFHGSSGRFSFTISAFGVGGLLGAVVLLGTAATRDRRRLSSRSALGYGVLVVAVALAPWFWAIPPLVLAGGLAMTASNTAANTLIQATAAPALRGQTVSVYMLAIRGGMALGSIVTGASVGLLGVRTALALDGILAIVAQLVIGWLWLRCELPAPDSAPAAT
jgi:MFS family permease